MSVKLFVEKLNSDKTIGMTTNQAMILENAKRIRITNIENTGDITGLIFEAGRYVAFVMHDETNQQGMVFMDFKKDRAKALFASKQFTESTAQIFMKNFEAVTAKYAENYNLVELVVDNNFQSDPSAN